MLIMKNNKFLSGCYGFMYIVVSISFLRMQ